MPLIFDNIRSFVSFEALVRRNFLPTVDLSLSEMYFTLFLYNNPSEGFKLAHLGLYSMRTNTFNCIQRVIKKGYINKVGLTYHLTGKGEILVNSFLEFCRLRGVIT
jgi:predicted transcriptional regulator